MLEGVSTWSAMLPLGASFGERSGERDERGDVSIAAERGASQNTLDAYRRDLRHFADYADRQGLQLVAVRPRDLSAYLKAISAEGLAPTSRARRLSSIRQLYRFLVAEGVVAEDPATGFAGPRRERPLPKVLSVAEVECLLDAAARRADGAMGRDRFRALRLKALLEVLYATGMRVSELVGLKLGQVSLDAGVVRVLGKGSKERLVPLGDEAIAWLGRYLAQVRPRLAGLPAGVDRDRDDERDDADDDDRAHDRAPARRGTGTADAHG